MGDICTVSIFFDEFLYFSQSSYCFLKVGLKFSFIGNHRCMIKFGGICESRTRLESFAGSCIATLPRRQIAKNIIEKPYDFNILRITLSEVVPHLRDFLVTYALQHAQHVVLQEQFSQVHVVQQHFFSFI